MQAMFSRLTSRYQTHILLLAGAQCLYVLSASANAMFTSLAAATLAPSPALATLPMSLVIIGTLATTIPLSLLMQRLGRRLGFQIGALCGVLFGVTAAISLYERSFLGFCGAALLLGVYQAAAMYYRYAALEMAPPHYHGRAVSYVIGGGLVAAVLAPSLFGWANARFEPMAFVGTFIALAVVGLVAMLALAAIRFPGRRENDAKAAAAPGQARPLREIFRQPATLCAVLNVAMAYGLMMLMMTAAPLAIVGCGFSVGVAASTIRWHMVAMFLPSFFTGRLIDRLGEKSVMLLGAGAFVVAGLAAAANIEIFNFKLALIAAGLGWNLMLTAGTVLLAKGYAPAEQAKVQGANEFIAFGLAAVASLGAGVLLDVANWFVVALLTIILSVLIGGLTWRLK